MLPDESFRYLKLMWIMKVVSSEMILYGVMMFVVVILARIFKINIPELATFLMSNIYYLCGLVITDRAQMYIDGYKKELKRQKES